MRSLFSCFFLDLSFLGRKEIDILATLFDLCFAKGKRLWRSAYPSRSFLEFSGKYALLRNLETKRVRLKPKLDVFICIKFRVFKCIQNCCPDVLRDVIAEGRFLKEMLSKLTL